MYDINDYNQENSDINFGKKNKKIFIGRIDCTVSIGYSQDTPMNFYPIHLNRSLEGMFTDNLKGGSNVYVFGCSTTSIFKLLSEIEYIRMYSKFKNLKIKGITIYIYSISNKKININLKEEEYNNFIYQELIDINRSRQLPRFFSGSVHANYIVKYQNTKEETKIEHDYSSIYTLVNELENLRNLSLDKQTPIQDITVILTNLEDSKIWYREKVMERKDKMAQREI